MELLTETSPMSQEEAQTLLQDVLAEQAFTKKELAELLAVSPSALGSKRVSPAVIPALKELKAQGPAPMKWVSDELTKNKALLEQEIIEHYIRAYNGLARAMKDCARMALRFLFMLRAMARLREEKELLEAQDSPKAKARIAAINRELSQREAALENCNFVAQYKARRRLYQHMGVLEHWALDVYPLINMGLVSARVLQAQQNRSAADLLHQASNVASLPQAVLQISQNQMPDTVALESFGIDYPLEESLFIDETFTETSAAEAPAHTAAAPGIASTAPEAKASKPAPETPDYPSIGQHALEAGGSGKQPRFNLTRQDKVAYNAYVREVLGGEKPTKESRYLIQLGIVTHRQATA